MGLEARETRGRISASSRQTSVCSGERTKDMPVVRHPALGSLAGTLVPALGACGEPQPDRCQAGWAHNAEFRQVPWYRTKAWAVCCSATTWSRSRNETLAFRCWGCPMLLAAQKILKN